MYNQPMDKYEQILKETTLKALSQVQIDLMDLAADRTHRLVAMITRLIVDEKEKFDVIISGGDSGLIVTQIVATTFRHLQLALPPIINLPIQRYQTSDLLQRFAHPDLEKYLPSLPNAKNILFVDDEIRIGWTAKTCFETLLKVLPQPLNCVIVAENHFFEWRYQLPQINLRFFAHAKVFPGINQIFAHLISNSEFNLIQSWSDQITDKQQAVALLLSGKYKVFTGDSVYFDEKLEPELLSAHAEYLPLKQSLQQKVEFLVQQGIEGYRRQEIKFVF